MFGQVKRKHNNQDGFTLVELIIIISVLSILSIVTIPRMVGIVSRSSNVADDVSITQIKVDLEARHLNDGEYPEEYNMPDGWDYERVDKDNYVINGDDENGEPIEYTSEHYFVFDEATGTITGYLDEGPRGVVIPQEIDGVEVSSLEEGNLEPWGVVVEGEEGSFFSKNLTSVVIPNTIIEIGVNVFADNNLTSVEMPDSITEIGTYAFQDNQLTSVEIPDSVTEIGRAAFRGNELTSVEIPDSVTEIGEDAFRGNELTSVEIPDSVTKIGGAAFMRNQLTSLVIPNSVTEIDNWTFQINDLTEVVIPNSVTFIGMGAFRVNQLTEVVIPDSVTEIEGKVFGDNPITKFTIPANVVLDVILGDDLFYQETFFKDYYEANGSQAGTYTRPDPESTDWNLE